MKSGRKNRAVMLHALANIEQWAIDLAWDIMARFGASNPDLPPAFFTDFTKMALDESKHLVIPSTPYGSMPVHASLWESAIATAHSLPARLAIIHLVHEARGLDVNPGTIERFRRAGDKESVEVMEIVHRRRGDACDYWTQMVYMVLRQGWRTGSREDVQGRGEQAWRGQVKGPFNVEDREKAGLTREFYEDLRGEVKEDDEKPSDEKESVAKVAGPCCAFRCSV
ncbi:Protein of unknown function (DUF455) domain containing protein [Amanita muscaria]